METFLSEITKDLLGDEIRFVKEKIRIMGIAIAFILVMLMILMITNMVILIKVA